jgi:hypothetical protein
MAARCCGEQRSPFPPHIALPRRQVQPRRFFARFSIFDHKVLEEAIIMAAQPEPLIRGDQAVVIRRATPDDAEVCGRICFEAFGTLADKYNFPRDFPAPEIPIHVLSTMFSHPSFFCVVAEQDGKIIGSNCSDERIPIAGVGPITIDPCSQNHSVGRQLMRGGHHVARTGAEDCLSGGGPVFVRRNLSSDWRFVLARQKR